MRSVWPAAAYAEQAKSIIWKLKFGGAQAAAGSMAGLMARAPLFRREQGARRASELVYIVPVPTATGRARQRGFDQAKLLARALSRQTRLPYLDCLARSGQAEQVGASRSQRLGQLEGAFRVKHRLLVRASCLILIDDVLTTGATLEAAAAALKRAGADIIDAVVFAQTEL